MLLGPLAIHAWQATQHGLNEDEAAARALFDEIRMSMTELDRLNGPQQECIEMRLRTAKGDRQQFQELLAKSKAEANTRCEQANRQLQECATQISQLRAALSERESSCKPMIQQLQKREIQTSRLHTELSDRINEGERMRGRIDRSTQASDDV